MEKPKGEQMIDQAKALNDEQVISHVSGYLRDIKKDGTKVIAVVGGPGSGKSVFTSRLCADLGRAAFLATDNYVKGDRAWRRANVEDVGKDPTLKYDPAYFNEQVLKIMQLQDGEELGIPQYDGASGIAISQDPDDRPDPMTYPTKISGPQDFVVVEGDFQFLDSEIVDKIIYLDVADDVRLENRLYRDSVERKEDSDPQLSEQKTRANFASRQATQFFPHTLPEREKADMVIKVNATRLEQPTPRTKFAYTYDVSLNKSS